MLENFISYLEKTGALPYVAGVFFLLWAIFTVQSNSSQQALFQALHILYVWSPVWLPVLTIPYAWNLWIRYIRWDEYVNRPKTVLEIKLPSEITQSPRAMEVILNVMYHTDESSNELDKFWKGKTAPWFSLEIASLEGKVHFYIWMRSSYKNIVESQLYAHYPDIEVREVPDYTAEVQYDNKTMKLWGIEQKKQNADPYPILTYVDFGLDKDPKEEFKIDPLHSIIEFLGSMGKGEFCFIQIGITSHTKRYKDEKTGDQKHWSFVVEKEVQKILERTKDPNGRINASALPEGDKRKLEAMQRNATKKPFDTAMRIIYIDKQEVEHASRNNGIPTMFRSFEHASEGMGYNGLKPQFITGYNYKLRDWTGSKTRANQRHLWHDFRLRQFFHWPAKHRHHNVFVMSSEELATLFHFPGRAAATPGLERITSRRASAPPNLPI